MATPTPPVALVIGASRGIGRQIAIDFAKEGYAVVVAAKSTSDASQTTPFPPDPNSAASTISTVEREIRATGGTATAIAVDTRSPASIQELVARTLATHARIDVLVYNSGAIWWASVANTPLSRFQLMQRVNIEGFYAVLAATLPHFEAAGSNARIVVVSPPIYSRFFRGKAAYAAGKVGMSVLTKGLAEDFKREGKSHMAITSLWPATAIQSAATQGVGCDADLRTPSVFSHAVLAVVRAPAALVNGELLLDEDFLRTRGVCDFGPYSLVPGTQPRRIMPAHFPDLRVAEHDDDGNRLDSVDLRKAKL